eukprot:3940744-Rhodomonas_salina.1
MFMTARSAQLRCSSTCPPRASPKQESWRQTRRIALVRGAGCHSSSPIGHVKVKSSGGNSQNVDHKSLSSQTPQSTVGSNSSRRIREQGARTTRTTAWDKSGQHSHHDVKAKSLTALDRPVQRFKAHHHRGRLGDKAARITRAA